MAGRLGQVTNDRNYPEINPALSNDNNAFGQRMFDPAPFDSETRKAQGPRNPFRIAPANLWAIPGQQAPNFFDDFYNRIHVLPLKIDLQTIASSQTREVSVWNAYVKNSATLDEISISQPAGIEITGEATPFSMNPLKEIFYNVTVGVSGPPNINVEILFDFSNVADQLPLVITGTRAVKFDIVPEVPVTETWEWLSDLMVATDGSEQRVALRGEVPRIELSFKAVFDSKEQIRRFYGDFLAAVGRLWLPEYQYTTRTTAKTTAGTNVLYYDNTKTDIRAGEYVLIQTPSNAALVEVASLTVSGALLTSNMLFDIPTDSLIMPGSPALIDNQTALARYAVDDVAEVSFNARLTRQRTVLTRTGSAVSLPQFLGVPVVEKRPLADELVKDEVSTGQVSLDNQTGVQDIISRWDYSRIGGPRTFKVNRMYAPQEMDYWKTVLAYARGQARKFWMPTYRQDLKVIVTPADAATNYTVEGTQYAEKVYSLPTHRYIEIETSSGTHRTSIIGASISGGNSVILFDPAVPTGAGWKVINRISYLLPVRINDDKIEWKHYGLESLLNLSIRTAEV